MFFVELIELMFKLHV